jgi:sirohydrochlorin ferrochelatase
MPYVIDNSRQIMSAGNATHGAAAVIVAHGERGGARSNAILRGHAGKAAESLPGVAVAAGVLSGDPTLEAALAEVADKTSGPILLYPFFMAPGYFVNVKIPKRLADAGLAERCRVLPVFGLEGPLPVIIRDKAAAAARKLGTPASECRLLLVGHGSKVARASAEATEAVAACLRELGGFSRIETAFLEEAPFVDDVIIADTRPTVVVGFFNGDGLHAAEDVPEAVGKFDGPITYTGPVGAFPEVSQLIAKTIAAAVSGSDDQAAAATL